MQKENLNWISRHNRSLHDTKDMIWAKVFNNTILLFTQNELLARAPTDFHLVKWTLVYDTLLIHSVSRFILLSKYSFQKHFQVSFVPTAFRKWNKSNQFPYSELLSMQSPISSLFLFFIRIQTAASTSPFHTRSPLLCVLVFLSSNGGIIRTNIKKCSSEDVPFNPSLDMHKIREESN